MGPINYMGAVPQLDIGKQFLSGLQAGSALGGIENAAEKQRLALAAAKQYQADLQGALANPNPQAFAALALKYPAQREAVKQSWDQLSEADRKQEGDTMAQSYSALLSGKPEIAKQVVQAQIAARKNSGLDTSHYDNALALLDADPQKAQAALGFTLAHINDPKAFATQFGALGGEQRAQEQAPAELDKKVADASTAKSEATLKGAQAKNAGQLALLDLQKKGWDIKNIESEIGARKEQSRIAAMNAALGRETNDLKRQELGIKIQEAQTALQDKVRAKVADAESAATNIDNMLNTIVRVKQHPGLDSVVGSIQGRLPAVISDENADAIALIDTLGSQAFLSLVPTMKGQGSLSNAEGEKLQAALQNLKRAQSETQFKANLDEAARILTKGRANVSKRYGVPLGNPDTPAAPLGTRPPLSSFGG
jgi:hypothetical protein